MRSQPEIRSCFSNVHEKDDPNDHQNQLSTSRSPDPRSSLVSAGQRKAISRLFLETDDEETRRGVSLVGSVIHLPRTRRAPPVPRLVSRGRETDATANDGEENGKEEEEEEEELVSDKMRQSGCTHIEITEEHVRIEFESGFSPGYQSMARLALLTEEEIDEASIPRHMIPARLENLTCLGAGATVFLDRKKVARHLSRLPRNASLLGLSFRSDLDSAIQQDSEAVASFFDTSSSPPHRS